MERKRLFGLGMLEPSGPAGIDIYTRAARTRTYEHLLSSARRLLSQGIPVILDAAFLRLGERRRAQALAHSLGVPYSILDCTAPRAVLRERLRMRGPDASEADERVMESLRAAAQPLTAAERAFVRIAP